MEDKEIWKPIIGYIGLYEVSSHGNVRSLERVHMRSNGRPHHVKARVLRFGYSGKDKSKSYYVVALAGGQKLRTLKVHRMVAYNFCDGYKEGLHVNHKDGNKLNNHYTNLEFCTQYENAKHAFDTGLMEGSMKKRKTIVQLTKEGIYIKDIFSASSMTKKGFHKGHILKCCQGIRNTHGGYKWMYKEDYEKDR